MIYTKKFNNDTEMSAWTSVHPNWIPAIYRVGNKVSFIPGKIAPEIVDLGLPSGLRWAKYNVGATSEEEYGKFFAWGDVTGSEATSGGCLGKYDKYWYAAQGLTAITASDLTAAHDAASMEYGGNWRMPTKDEIEELKANTTYSVEIINNIKGGKFTAKNGNYIFFPFAGDGYSGHLYSQGIEAQIWSSSCNGESNAWFLSPNNDGTCGIGITSRYPGYSVRGVAG